MPYLTVFNIMFLQCSGPFLLTISFTDTETPIPPFIKSTASLFQQYCA